jgi:hypothetical protein
MPNKRAASGQNVDGSGLEQQQIDIVGTYAF